MLLIVGIISLAALTIPSLFLSVFKESPPFSDLKAPKIEKTEKVGEEDCYLISGESTTSKKEVFWISKSRYLILKYYCSFEPPEGCAEMSDKELEVNDENKKKMREILNSSNDFQKKNQLKGSSTELHAEILFPEIKTKDFQFALPKSTTFKKSLFDVVLGKSKKDF